MNYHNDLCKFHGKFTELIPAGWKFQKLFASNYRQYSFEVTPYEYIRVWQAHGGYIEIRDFYSATKQIVEAVLLNNFQWHTYAGLDSYGFTIDRETGKIIPQLPEHDAMHVVWTAEKAGKSADEIGTLVDATYKKYSKARIDGNMINAIKDLANRGWIKV